MKRARKVIMLLISVCILALLLIAYTRADNKNETRRDYKVSLIAYGNTSGAWNSLKEGVNQASIDYRIEVNFVNQLNASTVEEQEQLVKREIDNGCDAIIIAPIDSEAMTECIEEAKKSVDVILVENSINDEDIETISANNYNMGAALANSISYATLSSKQVTLIMNGENRQSSIQRRDGFISVLGSRKYEIIKLKDFKNTFRSLNLDNRVFISFDNESLEYTASLVAEHEINSDVYGIGSGSTIVAYLDDRIIDGIVFQNEFNIGYTAIESLIEEKEGKYPGKKTDIDYKVINGETMYDKENQRLLFP